MKIVFVNPIWTLQNILPTNLAELAGYIRAHGYTDISIIDLNYELRNNFNANSMVEQAIDIVSAQKPDVIGMTCNTVHVPFCVEFCRKYKEKFKTPIVLGGIHATFRPDQMFKLAQVDYIVRGEGEETFLELLEALKRNTQIYGICGCSFKKGDKIIHNLDRPMIKDLSVLPFPAYDLLLPYIQQLRRGKVGTNADLDKIYIGASRGCPFGCIFCSSNKMWSYQRRKPLARVIREIQYFSEEFNIKKFSIEDDCLNLNKKWLEDLLQEIEKLNITWDCLMRIDRIDPRLLKKIRKGGCRNIYHGIESGSLRIRRVLDKKLSRTISNELIVDLVKQEIKAGIFPTCSFMTGIPTETKKDIAETVNLCMELRKIGAVVQLWIMTPYPGTKAVQMYKNKMIKIDRWKILQQSDVYNSEQFLLYHKFYGKYSEENPDFYMFKPDMELNDFFELYRKARIKIGLFDSKEKILVNYILETARRRQLVTATKKVQVEDIDSEKKFSCVYVSIKYPFLGINKIIKCLNKINPREVLLSIKSNNISWSISAKQAILRLITILIAKGMRLCLMRPIPLEFFDRNQRDLIRKLNMPKSCKDCAELFKINKSGNVELCTGRELFKKEFATSREAIYDFFMKIALWGNRPTDCIFSSRRKNLNLLKRNEKSDLCIAKASECFLNNHYDEAIKFLVKAKKYGYDGWPLYYYLGLCYKNKGQFDKALDEFREVEKITPDYGEIHFAIAQCYKRKNDLGNMWIEIEKGSRFRSVKSSELNYAGFEKSENNHIVERQNDKKTL